MSDAPRVIVTGGAGYIGSHACRALAGAGYAPVVYDNFATGNRQAVRWGPLEYGDVGDAGRLHEVFAQYRPCGVLHFAALALVGESVRAPARYYRTNVAGTLNLAETSRLHGVRALVLSSTCAVYGEPDEIPIAERAPLAPITPYGASKMMAERVLVDTEAAGGPAHMALRYFNAAGAEPEAGLGERRDVETHLLPLALDAATGRRPPITIMGGDYPTPDGTAIRDYIHVSDLAQAHVRALDYLLGGGASQALNIGAGRGYSVREVLDTVARVTGRAVPAEMGARRPGDPAELVADPDAARALLGRDLADRSDPESIVASAWSWQTSAAYAAMFDAARPPEPRAARPEVAARASGS